MKVSKFLFITILAAISLVFVASGSIKKDILGKWQDASDARSSVEFFSDNTVRLQIGKKIAVGTYVFLDDGRLKVTADDSGTKTMGVCKVEIKDGILVVTEEDGKKQTYKRIK